MAEDGGIFDISYDILTMSKTSSQNYDKTHAVKRCEFGHGLMLPLLQPCLDIFSPTIVAVGMEICG